MKKYNQKIIISIVSITLIIAVSIVYYNYSYNNNRSYRMFGVTYMTMNNPFYEVINNELLKTIESNGDQLITLDPALDVEKQIDQIYYLIDMQVSGIFINPIDSTKIRPALKAAKEANIPVIIIDAPVDDPELVNCTIVSDNYDAGVQCARDMMTRMASAKIVLLKHTAVKSAKDRIDGFLDTIASYPQYQVIDEGECEGQLELAMPLMQDILDKNTDVDVVMALNDPSALGALAALESKGRENVIVYGVDGTPDVKSLINQSTMVAGTVAQSPISIGQIASEKMYQYLSGSKIEAEVVIPVTLINKNNISQYDETGWQ
ncbi:sugar ABC transporter substrate-binding protein [uncultured Thomasclavelia sp.]|uniref:sugar ABC transporter substrate-binding protein n=1 Tax=uncultured Thomasclavelia sp. TaxID=3025759 RepID=UPI0025DDDFEC|nr:sugar ABC transporter substrate-binding protein [uncultured Thomasclavelia sp.]